MHNALGSKRQQQVTQCDHLPMGVVVLSEGAPRATWQLAKLLLRVVVTWASLKVLGKRAWKEVQLGTTC